MSVDPLGKTLFTGSTDFTIRSWHIYKGSQLKVFEGHQGSVICMQVGFALSSLSFLLFVFFLSRTGLCQNIARHAVMGV